MKEYKDYSMEKLDEWIHDVLSNDQVESSEIYDVIKKCIQQNIDYHQKQLNKCNSLMEMINNESFFFFNENYGGTEDLGNDGILLTGEYLK
jgi:hypothetical protein